MKTILHQNTLLPILLVFILAMLNLQAVRSQELGDSPQFYGDTIIIDLPLKQRQAFVESIQQKVYYLQHYIERIADKSIPVEERLEMVNSAVKLFSSENSIVEISNAATGEVFQLPVRQYFRRLAAIKATSVNITFYEGTQLETLRRAKDNKYYGTALIFQETKICKDAECIDMIQDRTIKRVNFQSTILMKRFGDEKEPVVDTLLENIKVKETKSI